MEPIKYYIATRGSPAGIERHNRMRDVLAAHGFILTFDWTIDMAERFAAGLKDHDLSFEHKRKYARIDRDAVHDAHFVVYLEGEKSEGASGETCFANAFKRRLFVSLAPGHAGPPRTPRALFAALANPQDIFDSDEKLIEAVVSAFSNEGARQRLLEIAAREPEHMLRTLDALAAGAERAAKIEAMSDAELAAVIYQFNGGIDMTTALSDLLEAVEGRLRRARGGAYHPCSWCNQEGAHSAGTQWACSDHKEKLDGA